VAAAMFPAQIMQIPPPHPYDITKSCRDDLGVAPFLMDIKIISALFEAI
jgi:hypothetical protein